MIGYLVFVMMFIIPIFLEPVIARQKRIEKSTRYLMTLLLALIGLGCVFYPVLFYPGYLSSGIPNGAIADQPWFRIAAGLVVNAIGLFGSLQLVRGPKAKGMTDPRSVSFAAGKVEVNNQQWNPCKDGSLPVQVELPEFSGKAGRAVEANTVGGARYPTIITFSGLTTYSCPDDKKRYRLPSDRFQTDLLKEMMVDGALPVTVPYVNVEGGGALGYVWPGQLHCCNCCAPLPGKDLESTWKDVMIRGRIETTINLPDVPPFQVTYEGEAIACPNCGTVMVFDYYENHLRIGTAIARALRGVGIRLGWRSVTADLSVMDIHK
jgi:hypothetical protein